MNEVVDAQAIHETLAVVLFSVGDWRVGIEACQVCGSRPAQTGALSSELAAALGLPALTSGAVDRQYLSLRRWAQDKEIKEILVDAPVDLVSLPVAAIHTLPPLLAARTSLRGLRALAIRPDADEQTLTLLFDANTF